MGSRPLRPQEGRGSETGPVPEARDGTGTLRTKPAFLLHKTALFRAIQSLVFHTQSSVAFNFQNSNGPERLYSRLYIASLTSAVAIGTLYMRGYPRPIDLHYANAKMPIAHAEHADRMLLFQQDRPVSCLTGYPRILF